MKKLLFGIAMILFAMLLLLSGLRREEFAVLVGFAGLVIAGIGAFTRDR